MTENQQVDKQSILFMGLVTSFQQNALIALGKLVNPVTGKTERDLNSASAFIDMLDMLAEKTKGNLHADETRTLEDIRSHLKLNYVEEVNKPETEEPPEDVDEKRAEETHKPETGSSEKDNPGGS